MKTYYDIKMYLIFLFNIKNRHDNEEVEVYREPELLFIQADSKMPALIVSKSNNCDEDGWYHVTQVKLLLVFLNLLLSIS